MAPLKPNDPLIEAVKDYVAKALTDHRQESISAFSGLIERIERLENEPAATDRAEFQRDRALDLALRHNPQAEPAAVLSTANQFLAFLKGDPGAPQA